MSGDLCEVVADLRARVSRIEQVREESCFVARLDRDGNWDDGGSRSFCPLRVFSLIDKSRGDWFWWDFVKGGWSAALGQSCLCSNRGAVERLRETVVVGWDDVDVGKVVVGVYSVVLSNRLEVVSPRSSIG